MKKLTTILLSIIFLSFAMGIYFYPQMPEHVATHWNASGEVDGYMPKIWGLFLLPLTMIFMTILYTYIPKIDPLKNNIQKFQFEFESLILAITGFLFYVYSLTTLWQLGFEFNMTYMIIPGISVLFFYLGTIFKKMKRNWFVGIRTPWTLSSDIVWKKTHEKGSFIFKLLAIIIFVTMFIKTYSTIILLIAVFGSVIYLFVYSYLEFKKLKH